MSEQRIHTGAEAATSTDADPGEGQGVADPQAQRAPGTDAEMPQPTADRPGAPGADGDADTEGAAALQEAQQTAVAQQRREPDLGGREPAGSDPGGTGGGTAPAPEQPARAETGEVSAAPSPERRAEDPGSVATEFGDRADSAPEDDIARPTI